MSKIKLYHFSQNNSGGSFEQNEALGIGESVYIEAKNARLANSKAKKIGIYFDGVDDGEDCECCGDRWNRASDFSLSSPEEARQSFKPFRKDGLGFIHYLDGTVETLGKKTTNSGGN